MRGIRYTLGGKKALAETGFLPVVLLTLENTFFESMMDIFGK